MARLADLLWTWKAVMPADFRTLPADAQGHLRESWLDTRARIAAAPVVAADNVCEYLFAGTDQEQWDYRKDFPCLAPPFERFFVEMKRPSAVVSREPGGLTAAMLPQMWGCYFEGVPRDESGCLFDAAVAKARECGDEGAIDPAVHDKCKWVLTATVIIAQQGVILMPWLASYFCLDADGQVLFSPGTAFACADLAPDDVLARWHNMAGVLCTPALLAISFLHCKNVAVQDVEPRALTPREVKAGQRPWVTYKTLDINPMRRVLRAEGGEEANGLRRALHVCRGHFATYGEDRPLFGRLAGRFWIPSHVRGSAERGAVVKDYRVNTPK